MFLASSQYLTPLFSPRSQIIFTIIVLNSFSRRLPISTLLFFWGFVLFLHLGHNLLPFHFCDFHSGGCRIIVLLTSGRWGYLRGLGKLPVVRTWWCVQLSLALQGRAVLSRTLSICLVGLCSLPVSFLIWGNPSLESAGYMVELMVISRVAHAKGYFLRLLWPVPLSLRWATADPCLCRRPSNISR